MIRSIFIAGALELAAILPAIPAQAASLTRTFVSSAGSDSNPCTITQPCATFAQAYSLTAAQGISSPARPMRAMFFILKSCSSDRSRISSRRNIPHARDERG
jgi:hypothetical protein